MKKTTKQIKDLFIKAIQKRSPLGFSRQEGDSHYTVIINKDRTVSVGGYADYAGGSTIEDLSLIDLAYLFEVGEGSKESLDGLTACLRQEGEEIG